MKAVKLARYLGRERSAHRYCRHRYCRVVQFFVLLLMVSGCTTEFSTEFETPDVPAVSGVVAQDISQVHKLRIAFVVPTGGLRPYSLQTPPSIAVWDGTGFADGLALGYSAIETSETLRLVAVNGQEDGLAGFVFERPWVRILTESEIPVTELRGIRSPFALGCEQSQGGLDLVLGVAHAINNRWTIEEKSLCPWWLFDRVEGSLRPIGVLSRDNKFHSILP